MGATGPDDTVATYSSPVGDAKWSILAPGGAGDGNPGHDIFSTYWEAGKTNSHKALAGTADPEVVCDGPHCRGRLNLARAVR